MDRDDLLAAIAAQEQLRGVVADEIVDAGIAALRSQLSDDDEHAPRRRQVTVLFADVTGFTAMSESMDAELVTDLMNTLWERLDHVVTEHGGRVDKHIGDAVMAVWGLASAEEDDPERAVRAGLAMQDDLAHWRASSGYELAMRVGVNTGPVMASTVGSTREFTVMGDAVNVASRLEHAAPPGGVLISHDTYGQVRGVFDVRPLDPIALKGKSEPVAVYLALRQKARAFRQRTRGVEGIETATVGRGAQLATVCNAFDAAATAGRAQSVVVVGESGVGKSRLLYEFDNWLDLHDREVFYFKARAVRSTIGARLGLIRDVVATRAGVTDGDTPADVLASLQAEMSPALDRREAAMVGMWLGFELSKLDEARGVVSGQNLGVVARAHLFSYLGALLAESPIVLLLEDVHWADAESLTLVEALVEHFGDEPILVVAATRPHADDGRSLVLSSTDPQLVELGPLTDDDARALVREILQRVATIPESIVDLVVGRAEGNPFYLEEFIKKLIDDRVIEPGDEGEPWAIHPDRLDATAIPATLTGVLQTRIDALGEPARRSVQLASVIGRRFWDSAVEALGSRPPELDAALDSELVIAQRTSDFEPAREFLFKHALLHDVAYATVLLSERPTL